MGYENKTHSHNLMSPGDIVGEYKCILCGREVNYYVSMERLQQVVFPKDGHVDLYSTQYAILTMGLCHSSMKGWLYVQPP